MPNNATGLIGVDWGTSSFRAYRIGPAGQVLDRIECDAGIRSVAQDGFDALLHEKIGHWIGSGPSGPIVMSGMIGSRQGWVEAAYIDAPASIDDVAGKLVRVPRAMSSNIFIVPGLAMKSGAMPDVMRGEETQIFGALQQRALTDGIFVLPGTHSKWAEVESGAIRRFGTYMTGDVFAALRDHSILGALMSGQTSLNADSFRRGLEAGNRAGSPGALLHRIFGARTHALFGELEADEVSDYLSGLLIGAEFADAAPESGSTLLIVGASDLAERYLLAAEWAGLAADRIDQDCAAAGLHAIAAQAALPSPAEEKT